MTETHIPIAVSSTNNAGAHSIKSPKHGVLRIQRTFRHVFESFRSKLGLRPRNRQSVAGKKKSISTLRSEHVIDGFEYGELWGACTSIASIKDHHVCVHDFANRQQKLNFVLKKQPIPTGHELRLPLQASGAPYSGVGGFDGESLQSFISMLPQGCRKISAKADPSGLVARLLPLNIVSKEARYVGSAFWLWLCAIDDLTEQLMGEPFEISIEEIKRVFRSQEVNDPMSDVVVASRALMRVITTTQLYDRSNTDLEDTWKQSFVSAVMEILHAFEAEKPLMATKACGGMIKMADWMNIRVVTISARPFMILGKASLGLSPALSSAGYTLPSRSTSISSTLPSDEEDAPDLSMSVSTLNQSINVKFHDDITKIEILTQCIMGLQNDILGWEKDHAEDNGLNSVEIYINQGVNAIKAMIEVVAVHNALVDRMMVLSSSVAAEYANNEGVQMCPTTSRGEWLPHGHGIAPISCSSSQTSCSLVSRKDRVMIPKYIELLGNQIWGMAAWTHSSKRYAA